MALRNWTRVFGIVDGHARYAGGFEWQVTNSDADRIANNRSVIRIRMWASTSEPQHPAWNNFDNTSWFEHDGGNRHNIVTRYDFRNALANVIYYVGTDTAVFSRGVEREITITHNSDGSRVLPITTFFFGGVASFNGITTTATITLPTIPRASSVTATNADIGSATSINILRFDNSFKHTLTFVCGVQNGTIATNVDTTFGWTIPTSFYTLIPNATSIVCTVTCQTFSGATLVGTSSTNFTASVNQTISSPIVNATVTDVNALSTALTGNNQNMVRFVSNARTVISATAQNSATIVSRSVVCGNLSSTLADSTLNGVESGSFVVSATDSRGFISSTTITRTLINYVHLTVNPLIYRTQPTNNEVAITFNGNYFNASFGTTSNSLILMYRFKETTLSYLAPTITIANPCVVTFTNHGLANGRPVIFKTTGALPTGILANTIYFIRSTGTNTFNLYNTSANAISGGTTGQIGTSGTQNGIHSMFESLTPILSGNTYTNGASPISLDARFDYLKSYDFEVIVNDRVILGLERRVTVPVNRGLPVFWWNKIGAFFEEKLWARNGIEIAGTSILNGNTSVAGTLGVSGNITGNSNLDIVGSSIDGIARDISNTNLNNLVGTGNFHGSNLTNAPNDGFTTHWYVQQIVNIQGSWQSQRAIPRTGTRILDANWVRTLRNGVWGGWQSERLNNAITLHISASAPIMAFPATWTAYNIAFDTIYGTAVGTKLTRSGNAVRVGSGVRIIEVSATFAWYNLQTAVDTLVRLSVNGLLGALMTYTTSNDQFVTVTTQKKRFTVSEGDLITVTVTRGATGNVTLFGNICALNVETIE